MPETNIDLSMESITAALTAAVAEKGEDFVYQPQGATYGRLTCAYVHDEDQPGCIFGNALMRLGVDPEWLKGYDFGKGGYAMSIDKVLKDLGVQDTDVLNRAKNAQCQQDDGKDWGTALAVFNRTILPD